jgi:hypothetical protein
MKSVRGSTQRRAARHKQENPTTTTTCKRRYRSHVYTSFEMRTTPNFWGRIREEEINDPKGREAKNARYSATALEWDCTPKARQHWCQDLWKGKTLMAKIRRYLVRSDPRGDWRNSNRRMTDWIYPYPERCTNPTVQTGTKPVPGTKVRV